MPCLFPCGTLFIAKTWALDSMWPMGAYELTRQGPWLAANGHGRLSPPTLSLFCRPQGPARAEVKASRAAAAAAVGPGAVRRRSWVRGGVKGEGGIKIG